MPRSRSEIQERKAVPVIGIDARRPRLAAGPRFDWVGRGDAMETDRMPAPELRHETRHARIDILKAAQQARSTRHLARIPEPGCSVHLITNGTFDFWDFIHATLSLATPRIALEFYASTWILNRRCAVSLLDLYDRGLIRKIGLITGIYFKRRESLDTRPPLAIVVDDLATTGTTMKLALAALRQSGVAALGFAYSGR